MFMAQWKEKLGKKEITSQELPVGLSREQGIRGREGNVEVENHGGPVVFSKRAGGRHRVDARGVGRGVSQMWR